MSVPVEVLLLRGEYGWEYSPVDSKFSTIGFWAQFSGFVSHLTQFTSGEFFQLGDREQADFVSFSSRFELPRQLPCCQLIQNLGQILDFPTNSDYL